MKTKLPFYFLPVLFAVFLYGYSIQDNPNSVDLSSAKKSLLASHDNLPVAITAIGDSCFGPGQEKHEDGSFENAYGFTALVTDARWVIKFKPTLYPWKYNKFCIGLSRNASSTDSMKFDIVIYDTTGTDGGPGNELGTLANQIARPVPVFPAFSWFSYDLTSVAGTLVENGSIYIGIKYNAGEIGNINKFIMVDETSALWPGYLWLNNPPWSVIQVGIFINYKCLAMRTIGSSASTVDPISQEIPNTYELSQNFPNPFNPITNIAFSIPKSGFVTLKVYNMIGKEIETLVNEFKYAGYYIVGFNSSNLPSGSYFYRVTSGNFVDSKKMLLIK